MTFAHISAFRLVTQAPERLLAFYEALGFTIGEAHPVSLDELAMLGIHGAATRWPMHLGRSRVDLDCYDAPGKAYPDEADAASTCFQHLALVTDDVAAGWTLARNAGARPISRAGPVTLPASSGGVTAVKFRDPEGHPLELLRFPDAAEKGWGGSGIVGIDHSAIAVRDLAASERFYRAHGLSRGDATLNRGAKQAALDGLHDPIVDVVPMTPDEAPPHVELLHYKQPSGAPCPLPDVQDVAATRIVWQSASAALILDPDGHLHQTGG